MSYNLKNQANKNLKNPKHHNNKKKSPNIQEEKKFINKKKGEHEEISRRKNPAYGRHQLSRPIRIVAPIPR